MNNLELADRMMTNSNVTCPIELYLNVAKTLKHNHLEQERLIRSVNAVAAFANLLYGGLLGDHVDISKAIEEFNKNATHQVVVSEKDNKLIFELEENK